MVETSTALHRNKDFAVSLLHLCKIIPEGILPLSESASLFAPLASRRTGITRYPAVSCDTCVRTFLYHLSATAAALRRGTFYHTSQKSESQVSSPMTPQNRRSCVTRAWSIRCGEGLLGVASKAQRGSLLSVPAGLNPRGHFPDPERPVTMSNEMPTPVEHPRSTGRLSSLFVSDFSYYARLRNAPLCVNTDVRPILIFRHVLSVFYLIISAINF